MAVEVFEGNTADPRTLGPPGGQAAAAFRTLEGRAGGRTAACSPKRVSVKRWPLRGLTWISALRSSAIRQLVESGAVQMSLFDQTDARGDPLRCLSGRAPGGVSQPLAGNRTGALIARRVAARHRAASLDPIVGRHSRHVRSGHSPAASTSPFG